MKKAAISAVFTFIIHAGFSQTNAYQITLDSISKIVIHYFQTKQADSIYGLAGKDFRDQMTQANFKSVSENQIFTLNNFQAVTFTKTTNGINKYKVAGTPDLQLLIGLDKENKLQTLLIQPYSKD